MTEDLEQRLAEHNAGKVKSTRNRKPMKLIHKEEFILKKDAHDRELFLKTGKGREHLKSMGL